MAYEAEEDDEGRGGGCVPVAEESGGPSCGRGLRGAVWAIGGCEMDLVGLAELEDGQ